MSAYNDSLFNKIVSQTTFTTTIEFLMSEYKVTEKQAIIIFKNGINEILKYNTVGKINTI